MRCATVLIPVLAFAPALWSGTHALNPKVKQIAAAVSEENIRATLQKLAGFGTRNTLSVQDNAHRGIGAARRWIFEQFRGYSKRLQVRYDHYRVKKQSDRLFRDVDLYNVVATLPGILTPERQIIVCAHYDSLQLVRKPGASQQAPPAAGISPDQYDWTAVDVAAPGANDDGSGTAAVLELARLMSAYEFDKTLVFIAFAGEEQGLVGSSLYAARAAREKQVIEAVLNNDIIGNDVGGNGRADSSTVDVFSGGPMDSPSRELARYVRAVASRYIPSMDVRTIFREDRVARGGDQTPFHRAGYAAVRFSTPNEDFSHQHTATDTLANMSLPYTGRVARINAIAAASLADAPAPPVVTTISRGKTRYDADLRWQSNGAEPDLAGYAVVWRSTTAPYWQNEVSAGKARAYLLPDCSIDHAVFGVKAIDRDGNESLVSPYVFPLRELKPVKTY